MSDVKYINRAFLNQDEGLASVQVVIKNSDDYCLNAIESIVQISDCRRVITLDFNAFDQEAFEKNIHKIKTLLSVLKEFHSKYEKLGKKILVEKEEQDNDVIENWEVSNIEQELVH